MAKVVGSNPIIRSLTRPAPGGPRSFRGPVQLLVDELVRALVVLAAHVADGPVVELSELTDGLLEEWLEPRVLDLVLAADLARDELRVVHDLNLSRAQRARQLEAEQHCA